MSEKTTRPTFNTVTGFVANDTQPVKPSNYDDWQYYYYHAREDGLSKFEAAEVAYRKCEEEK